jgi:hypothetical protein
MVADRDDDTRAPRGSTTPAGSLHRIWFSRWLGAELGQVRPRPVSGQPRREATSSTVEGRFRSPTSSRGAAPAAARACSSRSWRTLWPCLLDKCPAATVTGPSHSAARVTTTAATRSCTPTRDGDHPPHDAGHTPFYPIRPSSGSHRQVRGCRPARTRPAAGPRTARTAGPPIPVRGRPPAGTPPGPALRTAAPAALRGARASAHPAHGASRPRPDASPPMTTPSPRRSRPAEPGWRGTPGPVAVDDPAPADDPAGRTGRLSGPG